MKNLKLYYDHEDECWYVADTIGRYGYDNPLDAIEHFASIIKEFNERSCEGLDHKSNTWWISDARGIPLAKVCEHCIDDVLKKYRPDVLKNPNYWASEDID